MLVEGKWIKSSYSGSNGGNCVEVMLMPGAVAVRDSKDPDGPQLRVPVESWLNLVRQVSKD